MNIIDAMMNINPTKKEVFNSLRKWPYLRANEYYTKTLKYDHTQSPMFILHIVDGVEMCGEGWSEHFFEVTGWKEEELISYYIGITFPEKENDPA